MRSFSFARPAQPRNQYPYLKVGDPLFVMVDIFGTYFLHASLINWCFLVFLPHTDEIANEQAK